MKIVFLDGYTINPGDLDWSLLQACGDFTVFERTAPEEILLRSQDAEVLIVNKTKLGEEQFSALSKLKLVCVAATGYDNVDTQAAHKYGIKVCNCAGYSSHAVAQMVASLILEVADGVGEYARLNALGDWQRSKDFCYTIRPRIELVGKRMAIVGFGNIGSAVYEVMRSFGLHIYAVSSKNRKELPEDVNKLPLQEAFSYCDIVSLNCPLTPSNYQMVNAALLEGCNPHLILVNTARGGLVDEEAVACALRENRLGAYCADVLQEEPPTSRCPLLSAPHTYITPHIAWDTPDARTRILNILANNIRSFEAGVPRNVVI